MIIGSMTLLSIQFSLQYSFSILTTCSSVFVHTIRTPVRHCELNPIELIWAQVKGFVAKYNTTFRLKNIKELTYVAFGKITKDVWTKTEEHVVKIEKEYCKENCIDRSVIEPIIIDFCDDDSVSSI
jgi:hypothetical protein